MPGVWSGHPPRGPEVCEVLPRAGPRAALLRCPGLQAGEEEDREAQAEYPGKPVKLMVLLRLRLLKLSTSCLQ